MVDHSLVGVPQCILYLETLTEYAIIFLLRGFLFRETAQPNDCLIIFYLFWSQISFGLNVICTNVIGSIFIFPVLPNTVYQNFRLGQTLTNLMSLSSWINSRYCQMANLKRCQLGTSSTRFDVFVIEFAH